MTQHNNWLLNVNEHIAKLTLNRPAEMNNLNVETLHELREIATYLSSQSDIWVIILEGNGSHFSSGVDLDIFQERIDRAKDELFDFIRDQQRCLDAFAALEKVTIAKIHGFCLGGGLILAVCCDFRIASTRTIFSLPEVKLGIPILWGTQRVVRIVGVQQAKEMIMLGKRYRAEEALKIGLVNQIVSPQDLDNAVASLAARFTHLPPRTVGVNKRIIDQGFSLPLEQSEVLELEAFENILDSPDIKEAIDSYTTKREPHYTGK